MQEEEERLRQEEARRVQAAREEQERREREERERQEEEERQRRKEEKRRQKYAKPATDNLLPIFLFNAFYSFFFCFLSYLYHE